MARKDTALLIFARLLPADFRERVFEPALTDIWLEEGGMNARATRRWGARLVIVAESLRLGLPQFVWRHGRPTRLGGGLVAVMLVVALLVQRHNYVRAAGVAPSQADDRRTPTR